MNRDEVTQSLATHRFTRRVVLRAGAGGVAAVSVSALLAACGGSSKTPAASTSASGGSGSTATSAATTAATTASTMAATPAATTATAAAGGSTSTGTSGGTAKAGGTLTMAYAQSVADTLNQHISNFTVSRMVARHVLDCLVSIDPSSGDIKPWLATKWDISSDGLEYTFTLNTAPKFHDGTPFNADAIKSNFEYTMAPDTKRAWAYGALGGDKYDHTEAVDDQTAKVVFKKPDVAFLSLLSDGGLGIDSPAALQKYGDQYGIKALVGTGAFTFVEMVLNDHVTLQKNPDYNWGPMSAKHQGPALLDKLIFRDIKENATRAAALQSGDVQMGRLVNSQVAQFKDAKDITIIKIPKAGTSRMYLMNCTKAPSDDIKVRQAINMAVDKKALIQLPAWAGIGNPGLAPLPSNMVPNHDLSSLQSLDIAYDPNQANQMLDDAGWKMGSGNVREKDGKQLAFDFVTTTDSVPQVDPLNGMLSKIGVKLNIQTGDFNFWIDNVTKRNFDMTLMSDSGFNPAGLIEEFFYSKGPYADYLAADDQIDSTIEAAVNAPNQDEMWKNLFSAMEMIMKQVPGVMAWEDMYIDGAHSTLQDVGYNESGFAFFYDTWIQS